MVVLWRKMLDKLVLIQLKLIRLILMTSLALYWKEENLDRAHSHLVTLISTLQETRQPINTWLIRELILDNQMYLNWTLKWTWEVTKIWPNTMLSNIGNIQHLRSSNLKINGSKILMIWHNAIENILKRILMRKHSTIKMLRKTPMNYSINLTKEVLIHHINGNAVSETLKEFKQNHHL